MTTNNEIRKTPAKTLKSAQKRYEKAEKALPAIGEPGYLEVIMCTHPALAEYEEAQKELKAAEKAMEEAEEICRRRDRANRAKWLKDNDWWHMERGGPVC